VDSLTVAAIFGLSVMGKAWNLVGVGAAAFALVTGLPLEAAEGPDSERPQLNSRLEQLLDSVAAPVAAPIPRAVLTPAEVREVTPPAPAAVLPPPKVRPVPSVVRVMTGEASWYGPGFYGNRTASGEIYRPGTMTAAHRTLPFGTKVRVTNLWNGRSAVIRINDRGPFIDHRVIDLGHGAASELGLTASGIAQVKLEVLR
tara:strand:+ start:1975 stop:2574 length:600 start_codon:yes stop_codon:yes gene_type:complete